MDKAQAAKLRRPFDKAKIEKLPKAGMQLDYVSHATTTDRLLEVDPDWTWHPMGLTPEGLPAFDSKGGLWINLTVCGVTRPGYGEPGRIGAKEAIGDAIRNAAMRFGVALDLWAKVDLDAHETPRPEAGSSTADREPAGDEHQRHREEVSGKYNPSPEEVKAGEARRAHEQRSTLDLKEPDRENITPLQVRRLFSIARGEYELSDATIKATIEAVTGQTSSRAIPRYKYDAVMDELARVALAVPK